MNDDDQLPISAKGELILKVSEGISDEKLGPFFASVSDIVPISNAPAYTADQNRIKRQNLRLQQNAVVDDILLRGIKMIANEGKTANAVPTKTLVPLLEKGSQEDPRDTYMIDRWAALLATAATGTDVSPRLVSILSELNGRQAILLTTISIHSSGFSNIGLSINVVRAAEAAGGRPYRASFPESEMRKLHDEVGPGMWSIDKLFHDDYASKPTVTQLAYAAPERSLDLRILESIGLVRFETRETDAYNRIALRVVRAEITFLGSMLLLAVRADDGSI